MINGKDMTTELCEGSRREPMPIEYITVERREPLDPITIPMFQITHIPTGKPYRSCSGCGAWYLTRNDGLVRAHRTKTDER